MVAAAAGRSTNDFASEQVSQTTFQKKSLDLDSSDLDRFSVLSSLVMSGFCPPPPPRDDLERCWREAAEAAEAEAEEDASESAIALEETACCSRTFFCAFPVSLLSRNFFFLGGEGD